MGPSPSLPDGGWATVLVAVFVEMYSPMIGMCSHGVLRMYRRALSHRAWERKPQSKHQTLVCCTTIL